MALYGFRRSGDQHVAIRLDVVERGLLRELASQVTTLVTPESEVSEDPLARLVGIDPDAIRPQDPALARLLPDGYGTDDPEASQEFRRFTERSLRETKIADASNLSDSLGDPDSRGRLRLDAGQALSWVRCLTDIRLALAVRLGIDGPEGAQHDSSGDDPARDEPDDESRYAIYEWLGYLQDTLVSVMPPVPA